MLDRFFLSHVGKNVKWCRVNPKKILIRAAPTEYSKTGLDSHLNMERMRLKKKARRASPTMARTFLLARSPLLSPASISMIIPHTDTTPTQIKTACLIPIHFNNYRYRIFLRHRKWVRSLTVQVFFLLTIDIQKGVTAVPLHCTWKSKDLGENLFLPSAGKRDE